MDNSELIDPIEDVLVPGLPVSKSKDSFSTHLTFDIAELIACLPNVDGHDPPSGFAMDQYLPLDFITRTRLRSILGQWTLRILGSLWEPPLRDPNKQVLACTKHSCV